MKENLVQNKSFEFSLKLIKLYKILIKNNEYIISKQLLRSGTSIGANIEEAIAAQTKKDFLSKIYIALKEARETRYWLKLLRESAITQVDLLSYLEDIEGLINILTKITKTTENNLK